MVFGNLPVRERLEYEYELSTCFFARVCIALFSTGSEGLHYLELSVLSEGVVNTDTPRFNVAQEAAISPAICGTEPCIGVPTIFCKHWISIEVFNPSIPRLRRSEVSFIVSNLTNPYFRIICFAVFTMFFAVLLKKYAPAMTFSLALALLPMYILNSNTDGQTLYLIPLPAGVMISTGYIKGTQKSEFTEDYFFREVEYSQMILVF